MRSGNAEESLMRKFMAAIAVLTLAVSLGHAETSDAIARCSGTAGVKGIGVPPNPSVGGACKNIFTLTAPTPVLIKLEPSTGYVGSLQAVVSRAGEGHPVAAFFVNDTPVFGMASVLVTLGDGEWS